jgi:hypothetical protein
MKLKGCEVTVQVKTVGGEHNCSHVPTPICLCIPGTLTGDVDCWADGVLRAAKVEFHDARGRVFCYIPVDSILEPSGALFNFSPSEEG